MEPIVQTRLGKLRGRVNDGVAAFKGVFDSLGPASEPLLGREPPQALADAMHRAWVAFAASGDCGWPEYNSVGRPMMRFDAAPRVVEDPLAATLALWRGVR